jgi:alpha-methylacyl-CoA racemase
VSEDTGPDPQAPASGPLAGVRVVELGGIGPVPYAGMLLADLGADVLRVERDGGGIRHGEDELMLRGRRTLTLDLKNPADLAAVRRLVAAADVLVEGYRPGVAERLGLGPDECLTRNPRLVYARMTGWGQDGPLAARAGHDITYAAVAGALGAVGEPGRKPVPPLNLIADFGGGSLFLVIGVLAALLERSGSGRGQVVDAAMVDGVSSLLTMTYSWIAQGRWRDGVRGGNLLDGGAPYYDTYECADGGYIAVGALEPQFFATLVATLGWAEPIPAQHDVAAWPQLRERLAATFRTKSRDEWAAIFDGVDACVAPVLTVAEAGRHPQLAARHTVIEPDGVPQPAPAPRFSRTPGAISSAPGTRQVTLERALAVWQA